MTVETVVPDNARDLRQEVEHLIASGEHDLGRGVLRELWHQKPGPALAGYVVSRAARLTNGARALSGRVAILRSFSVEPVVPVLKASAAVQGIDLDVQVGDFNTYPQDVLNPASSLYAFAPNVAILAVQTRDIAPEVWCDVPRLSATDVDNVVARVVGEFTSLVETFRSRSQAHLVIHGLEAPSVPSQGVLDSQVDGGQMEAVARINAQLRRLTRQHTGVFFLDYDALVARYGRESWHDEKKWLTMRMPVAADHLSHLADEWLRFIQPLLGKQCKVVVTDLDNTLWGGVLGEDGPTGIQLNAEYPGAAFRAVQRALLDLYDRGILIALCSKNNAADVDEVLNGHPDMLLKPRHIAAQRVNWQDKAQNLREIAAELNLGLDALAFLDDNPVERQWVRQQLPEVTVIELPNDPMRYERAIRDCAAFERLSLSAEDRERGRYYAEERQRTELQQSAGTLEDFYRSLQMRAVIRPVTEATLGRVAQLTQKTNQFNMTTRRYSEQEIAALTNDPRHGVYTLTVQDRFGDTGLVGVAITRLQGSVCEIDTLLMSCRVIGRTVETMLLATLAEDASARGATTLAGWFLPTKKNAPARGVYEAHGFACTEVREDGSRWELDLTSQQVPPPPWIERDFQAQGAALA